MEFQPDGRHILRAGEQHLRAVQLEEIRAFPHQAILPVRGIQRCLVGPADRVVTAVQQDRAAVVRAAVADDGAVAAVWGGPEEGVSGTLELDLKGISSSHPWTGRVPGLETFTAQAERREDGWFIFQFVPHDNHLENTSCAMEILLARGPFFSPFGDLEQPYRLTLTDSQGNTVAQQSGTTPPDQRLQKW